MKTILLPTDFSENAANAVNYAINMYGSEECKFILLNTYKTPHAGASMLVSIEDLMHKETVAELEQEVDRIRKAYPDNNLNLEIKAEFGDILMGLERVIREESVDLIIMGTKGASGVKEAVLGSNTAAVIKKITKPVLTVPAEYNFIKPVNIIFAADYNELDTDDEINSLISIAKKFNSKIGILKVHTDTSTPNDEEVANALNFNELFEGVEHSFIDTVEADIVDGIESYVNNNDADMLVLVSRKHSFLDRILNKSVSKKLVMHAKLPVLILHDNN